MILLFVSLQRKQKRNMKYSELERLLKKNGCIEKSRDGRHPIWYSPITNKHFTTGHHGKEEVKPGTLKSILKQAGII